MLVLLCHNITLVEGNQTVAPEILPHCRCLLNGGHNHRSVPTPKIFICYMMHESALSSHTTLHDPRPHLHRCNMTPLPPSILACGGDSMNFYYAACECRSVWRFSFDLDLWDLEMHQPLWERAPRFLLHVFEFSFLKSEQICIANLHVLRVFFLILF